MKKDILRAPFVWFGGKGLMIKKLMNHVPLGGKPYCEPFAGAATLFFARPPAPVEVLNDIDGDIVNLFKCLQDKNAFDELAHRLRYTLYSRQEFGEAIEIIKSNTEDKIKKAWAFFVLLNQGMSGIKANTIGHWSRAFTSNRGMAKNTNRWLMRLSMLEDWHKRLLMAQIDNRDALEVIKYWNTDEAVFYIDPPYIQDTRKFKKAYCQELDNDYYQNLVKVILDCKGAVVLSGYEHDIYQPLIDADWDCTKYHTACHAVGKIRGSKLVGENSAKQHLPRIECVFSNRKAIELMKRQREKVNEKLLNLICL
jgi:DNA adenine methylase